MDVDGLGPTVRTRLTQPQRPTQNRQRSELFLWIALFVSILLGLVSGTLYAFGRYEKDLKNLLGITQLEVQRFGIFFDCGNYVGHPLTGFFYDRMGPRISCVTAAIVVFCSYLSIHLGINYQDTVFRSQTAMEMSFFLVGFGSGLGYISALGTTSKNFEKTPHFSTTIGLVAAGFGLCSTVVGLTYSLVDISRFFLLWAFLVSAVNLTGAYFLVEFKHEDSNTLHESDETSDTSMQRNEPVWNSWRDSDFWFLFVVFMCCTGCGLFVINNISTMVESVGGSDGFSGSLVIIFSLCNCFARILTGYVTDKEWMSRLSLFSCMLFIMTMNMFSSAALYGPDSVGSLGITAILTALAYGGSWVLIVCILSKWFGNHNFGKNYGLMVMGPAISGMVFNTISAEIYETHEEEDSEVCLGAVCYRGSFIFAGVAGLLGLLFLSCLAWRRSSRSSSSNEHNYTLSTA